MATLKREVKKLPSESNLRLLSSLIVSLANKQSSLEDKCIAPWKADETYQKDISYVSHNGYVYICSVTNQDSVFTESHWTKLADEFTELDVDTIKSYLNLTQEQITNLQTLIDDTTITTTKTNSSSKIYMDIQAAIAECKDDTLKQIAKKVSGSYKIATSTAEVTSADHIYLISNGSNYDLYVLVDSVPTKVGDTSIDLSDYAKLTDLDSYYDKATSDGKFATITTVDNHIDDTDIHVTKELKDKLVTTDDIATTIDSTSTNDTIIGTKAIYDYILANTDKFDTRGYAGDLDDVPFTISNATHCYLIYNTSCTNIPNNLTGTLYNTYFGDDKWATQLFIGLEGSIYTRNKANGTWSSWERYLRTADLTQTIDSSSTDTQVPSAKASYDITKYNTIGLDCPGDKSPLEFALENTNQNKIVYFRSWGNSTSDRGDSFSTYIAIRHQDDRYVALFCIPPYGRTKINNYQIDTWTGWQELLTSSPSFSGTGTLSNGASGIVYYKVKNGVAYVSVHELAEGLTGTMVCTITGLPKVDVYVNVGIEKLGSRVGTIYTDDGTTFYVHKTSTDGGYASFSYPIAE